MVAQALSAGPVLKLDVVPRGVLTPEDLALALRNVRPGDALLAPEASNLDIPTAILQTSLAARVAGGVHHRALGGSRWSGVVRTRLLCSWFSGGKSRRQASSRGAAVRRACRRHRQDRPRPSTSRPRICSASRCRARSCCARTHSGDERRRAPGPPVQEVRRRPSGPGRRSADGVEPRRALLLLPGNAASNSPRRARESRGDRRTHRAVHEGHRAPGPRYDAGCIRRSRGDPGRPQEAGVPRGTGRGPDRAARAGLSAAPAQRPRRHRDQPPRRVRQGTAPRVPHEVRRDRQPGRLLAGPGLLGGANREDVRQSRVPPERIGSLRHPRRPGGHLRGRSHGGRDQPEIRPQVGRADRGRRSGLRLRAGLARPSICPSRRAARPAEP